MIFPNRIVIYAISLQWESISKNRTSYNSSRQPVKKLNFNIKVQKQDSCGLHACGIMFLDSRLGRRNFEIVANCSLEHFYMQQY